MQVEITGKIVNVLPTQSGQGKNGEWVKNSFVIEWQDNGYKQLLRLEVNGAEKFEKMKNAVKAGENEECRQGGVRCALQVLGVFERMAGQVVYELPMLLLLECRRSATGSQQRPVSCGTNSTASTCTTGRQSTPVLRVKT